MKRLLFYFIFDLAIATSISPTSSMIKKVVVGVSGGVDSCMTAYLLKRKGFEVQGMFMRNWEEVSGNGMCTGDKEAEYASYICSKLGIPFKEVNFVREYWLEVFRPFLKGYQEGMSPNPDILCNKHIKFGHFFNYATNMMGADAVATGHYARNSFGQFLENSSNEKAKLLMAVDHSKDQTLFLSQIPQKSLQKTMFPIGGYFKHSIKKMAEEIGLDIIAKKKESTGICFIGKRHFQTFMKEYLPETKGEFVDLETGKVVGEHGGVHLWTLGQRVLIGGLNIAYFVAERDPKTQIIKVVQGTKHPALFFDSLITEAPHWINENPFLKVKELECKFRFQHTSVPMECQVTQNEDKTLHLQIMVPLRAITSGQYATFYIGEECLGSAAILKNGPSKYDSIQRSEVLSAC